MIGIQAVVAEIPERRVETLQLASAVGADESLLRTNLGFMQLARKALAQDTSDLCVGAAHRLFAAERIVPSDIDCVCVVTQNPDGYGIPHVAAIVHAKLGLPESCASFDIGLGGSGYVYGLAILKSLMESNGQKRGLFFTCDPYSRIVGEFDGHAALQFGDAASVTLLTDKPVWAIGRCDFGTTGARGQSMQVRVRLGGRLVLDAEAVSEFAVAQGAQSLRRVVEINGLNMERIDRIIVHQMSRAVVQGIGHELGAPGKVNFYAESYGDTVSSSIPIVLAENVTPGMGCIGICGFGSGLSWASTVLTRVS